MRIVPVLDLMGGIVVHGRGGRRESYAPIRTPLGDAEDAPGLAARLLDVAGADTLYVADLDAIMGGQPHNDLLARIAARNPDVEILIDGGFATPAQAARLSTGLCPVFGTETLSQSVVELPSGAVLSLDHSAEGFLGANGWMDGTRQWPQRVICMTMAAVGGSAGPDLERVRAVVARAAGRTVYAAGGVRGVDDLKALKHAGCAGALVATALHAGRIPARY